MNPLAVEIWFSIAIAYVLVSLTMWIVARFSPFEWNLVKPNHPNDNDFCNVTHIKNNENLKENHFNFTDYAGDADDDDSDGFYNIDLETELICIENDFTLRNSFWFTIGSLLQQGSDLSPKVIYFFVLFDFY